MKQKQRGFTIVELLISVTILAIVLGIIGTIFAAQVDLNRKKQARSEVQDKVRLVMQLVTQDLQMAGASRYVDNTGTVFAAPILSPCPDDPDDATIQTCIKANNSAAQDDVSVAYITSLRDAANACRRVGYALDANSTLQRADQLCDNPTTHLDPADATDLALYQDLADNIIAFDVQYRCSDSTPILGYPDDVNCPTGVGYARSAVVTIVGMSNNPFGGVNPESFTTITGQNVNCTAGFICYELTQEVLMPNMKDN
jgi:prepilin-type N-terminal cleavage/methylation domain-containing protein